MVSVKGYASHCILPVPCTPASPSSPACTEPVIGALPFPALFQPPAWGRILDTMLKTITGAAWASREETGRLAMCSGLGGCGGWRRHGCGGLNPIPPIA